MYLKRIEAQGFKSFANKAVFDFEPGIMGIVGPNGSGKSNVADAVRWVLGEQSARQLRGSNMQDVIFSGTESRRAMSYAYVAITLDNHDHSLPVEYDEVTVSRQLFRSGESEYRLNGSVCRMRDVHELFYDTGIGRDGYSIIGQGQIDRILSNKPEERREMFDEAVGIVKFKRRKQISVKKLEEEHQDLLRITDIVTELEHRVGPLARQSEMARKYLVLRDELKNAEVGAYYLESSDEEAQAEKARGDLALVSGDLEDAHREEDRLKEHYDSVTEALAALEQTAQERQERRTQLLVQQENLEGRIGVLNEQIRAAQSSREAYQRRSEALAAEEERLS